MGRSCWRARLAPDVNKNKGVAELAPLTPSLTPKSDQLQFSLSVSNQRYIIQYGEFGNR